MHVFAATGAGFLVAVLWFDLMFDVQARGHAGQTLPPETLASIAGYYRRVTTEASPMGQLVAVVMLATLGALVAEIITRAPVDRLGLARPCGERHWPGAGPHRAQRGQAGARKR
jgi:hypothetical protein